MKALYTPQTANFPRLKTDACFSDYRNTFTYSALMDGVFRFVTDNQLKNAALWQRFTDQFRLHSDEGKGWRGEYWGKMMRGACLVYSGTQDPELYEILCRTVQDMAQCMEPDGRLSTYPRELEFKGWDMWCRKYVLLGMQYFL